MAGFSGGVGTKDGTSGDEMMVSVIDNRVVVSVSEDRSGDGVTRNLGVGIGDFRLFSLSTSSSTLKSKRLPTLFLFGELVLFFGDRLIVL